MACPYWKRMWTGYERGVDFDLVEAKCCSDITWVQNGAVVTNFWKWGSEENELYPIYKGLVDNKGMGEIETRHSQN